MIASITLRLSDPFFYGPVRSVVVPVGGQVAVENLGDAASSRVVVEMVGDVQNPQLVNSTAEPDVMVRVGSSVAVGDSVVVDVEATTVVRSSDGANLIGALSHSGSVAWFGLQRGVNDVSLSASGGSGHAVVSWRERWF